MSKPMLTQLWAADKFEQLLQSSLDKAVVDYYHDNQTLIDKYLKAFAHRLPTVLEPRQTYEPKQVASLIWAFVDSSFSTYMGAPLAHYLNGLRLKRLPRIASGGQLEDNNGPKHATNSRSKLMTLQTQLFGYVVNYFVASQLDKYFGTHANPAVSAKCSSSNNDGNSRFPAESNDPSKQLVNSTRKILDLIIALGYLYHLTPYHSTRSWVLKQRFVYANDPEAIDYRSTDRLARAVHWLCFTFLPYAYVASTIARGVIDHCHTSGYYSWAAREKSVSVNNKRTVPRGRRGRQPSGRTTQPACGNMPAVSPQVVDQLEPPPMPNVLVIENVPPSGYCALCKNRFRGSEATLACCGVVFCYSCLLVFVQQHRRCPVTRDACCENDIIKLNY